MLSNISVYIDICILKHYVLYYNGYIDTLCVVCQHVYTYLCVIVFLIVWARQTAVVTPPLKPQPLQHQHSRQHLPLQPPPLHQPPLLVRVPVKLRKNSQQLFYLVRTYVKRCVAHSVTFNLCVSFIFAYFDA